MEKTVFMQLSARLNPWGLDSEKVRGKKNLLSPPLSNHYIGAGGRGLLLGLVSRFRTASLNWGNNNY